MSQTRNNKINPMGPKYLMQSGKGLESYSGEEIVWQMGGWQTTGMCVQPRREELFQDVMDLLVVVSMLKLSK